MVLVADTRVACVIRLTRECGAEELRKGMSVAQVRTTSQTSDSRRFLNPPKPGNAWWMREGKGYTLCEALYKELQKYTPAQLGLVYLPRSCSACLG